MKWKVLLLASVGLVASCSAKQVSVSLLASYDAAVSAEIVALSTGVVPQASKAALGACRKRAYNAVEAVVKAEQNGSDASSLANVAIGGIAALNAAAADVKAGASVKQPCGEN